MAQESFRCTGCNQNLYRSEFRKNASRKSGLDSRCKKCRAIVQAEYRNRPENKERERIYHAARYKSEPEYREAQKKSARKPDRRAKKAEYQKRYRDEKSEEIRRYNYERCRKPDVRIKLAENRQRLGH